MAVKVAFYLSLSLSLVYEGRRGTDLLPAAIRLTEAVRDLSMALP
jgi:hypothetical protein